MRLLLVQGTLLATIISLHLTSARPQEEGYNYEVPENPLVISRPDAEPLGTYGEPIETENEAQSEAQDEGGHGHHGHSGDPLDWLRESIPGEPETDYPIFAVAPDSSFVCDGKDDGMYADVEARCQVWHQCFADRSWSFLCPNGTIFNQEIFTCVWWFDFDCSTAESFYGLNADLYKGPSGGNGDGGGSPGSDSTSDLLPDVIDLPAEEAGPIINEPVILDPVVPDETEYEYPAEYPAEYPDEYPAEYPADEYSEEYSDEYTETDSADLDTEPIVPVVPIAPEPAPQPTPSIEELPLEPYEDETEIDAYGDEYDEYDPNDIPIEQRAPEGYGAPPPAPDYELPDYEVPDYEAPAVEEVVDIKSVEEELPVEVEEVVEDAAPVEETEGYSYPVPENPLELPEKHSQLADDAVAPLALYGAPAQPFEIPETLPTAAPEELEELPLAQYLPPASAPREARGGRFGGRLSRRGRRRGGQRRKRLIRTVRYL